MTTKRETTSIGVETDEGGGKLARVGERNRRAGGEAGWAINSVTPSVAAGSCHGATCTTIFTYHHRI